MHYFEYRNDELYAEDVPMRELARRFGTPFYVYSARTLRRHFRVFDEAFAGTDHLICYAMKALSNLSILKLFASMGSGLRHRFGRRDDALPARGRRSAARSFFRASARPTRKSPPRSTPDILMINVESRGELHRISEVAGRMKKARAGHPARQSRPRPRNPSAHFDRASRQQVRHPACRRSMSTTPRREICPIWSWSASAPISDRKSPIPRRSPRRATSLPRSSGGCAAQASRSNTSTSAAGSEFHTRRSLRLRREYGKAVLPPIAKLGLKIIAEPGRVMVGNAGVLVTKVLYNKETDVKRFIIVDAAMNDLIRPVLYEAYHNIQPVKKPPRRKSSPPMSSGRFARAAISSRSIARCRSRRRATCSR